MTLRQALVFFIVVLFVVSVPSALAQPRFTQKNLPIIGTVYTKTFCNTDKVTPGPIGNDVTWDFSQVLPIDINPSYVVRVLPAKDFPQSSQFPAATIAFRSNDTTIEFITTSKNTVNKTGTIIPSCIIQLTETYDLGPIPISSGGKLKDSYKADLRFTDGRVGRRTGNVQLDYDGFGTLITPSYTIAKTALRLKIIDTYTDSIFVQPRPIIILSRDTTYRWYSSASTMPLFEYKSGTIAQQQQPIRPYKTIWFTSDTVGNSTSVIEEYENKTIMIIPQPASDNLIIALNTEQTLNQGNISFTDITGRTIMTLPILTDEKFITIPVSALDNGMYMVRITFPDEKILHTKCMIMR